MSETAAPAQKRVNDPDGMRRKVLDAAAEAFQKRGYHSTSMQDIRQLAGTTGGALHHHFPTKKDLGLAVLRERVAGAVESTWIAPVRSAETAAEGILAVFESIIAELEARGAVTGCPLNNLALELSLADPDFRAALSDIYETWRTALAERLRGDALDPDALATFVVASYSGAMAMAKAAQNAGPLRTCAAQLSRIMKRVKTKKKRRKKRSD